MKLLRCPSFKFPITLADCRNATFNRLLPLGKFHLNSLPPLILLLGANLNHAVNSFDVLNFLIPSTPILLIWTSISIIGFFLLQVFFYFHLLTLYILVFY